MRSLTAKCGIVLLAICFVDCGAWRATQEPLSALEGKRVRVTTSEGEQHEGELTNADSLGLAVLYREFHDPKISAIDTTTIRGVEKRGISTGRTVAMSLCGVIVLGIVALAVVTSIENLPE